jgi:hypothetical protein
MQHELGNQEYTLHPEFLDADQVDGIDVDDLPVGAMLEIETGHTRYILETRGEGKVLLSGHPEYCPEPVLVQFHGSVGGPTLIRPGRIEPGMKMAFQHPKFGTLRTSRVRSVREARVGAPQ